MAVSILPRSQLLRIPFEVRLCIYEYLFDEIHIRVSMSNEIDGWGIPRMPNRFGVTCSDRVHLLSTCRQIRQEALPVFCHAVQLGLGFGVGSKRLNQLIPEDILSGITHVYARDDTETWSPLGLNHVRASDFPALKTLELQGSTVALLIPIGRWLRQASKSSSQDMPSDEVLVKGWFQAGGQELRERFASIKGRNIKLLQRVTFIIYDTSSQNSSYQDRWMSDVVEALIDPVAKIVVSRKILPFARKYWKMLEESNLYY